MSDTPKPPAKPKPAAQPTPDDVSAIASATQTSVENSTSPEEARTNATATIREETAARNIELSEEQIKFMVDMMITELEKRGAFEKPPAPEALTPAETAAPVTPENPPEPPRRKTWAERFVGR